MARRRRKMLWAPFGIGLQTLAASAAVGVDLVSLIRIAVPSIANYTVVRILGSCGAAPTASPGSPKFFDAGIIVTSQAAFDAGAFPDPVADDVSWLWFGNIVWDSQLVREFAAGSFTESFSVLPIDAKSKRKVPQADNTVIFVIRNRQAVAADFFIEGRMLLDQR